MENKSKDNYDLPLIILENERSRISRELHDVTIQSLVHTIHQTELIAHYMDQDPIKAKLELSLLAKNLKKAITETRNVIYDLKPMAIDDLGISAAMEECFIYLRGISDLKFIFHSEDELEHLDSESTLMIFRILQEACNNAVKHSQGSYIKINIERIQDNFYKITIDDDGVGCNIEDMQKINHYGLEILKERVAMISGNCEIRTEPNQGFHMVITFPMTC